MHRDIPVQGEPTGCTIYFQFISIINLYMFRAGLLLIIRRYYSVYTAVVYVMLKWTLQHQHNKNQYHLDLAKQVNINGMFNKFILRKNFLHFLKYFYCLIIFNIIWNSTHNKSLVCSSPLCFSNALIRSLDCLFCSLAMPVCDMANFT